MIKSICLSVVFFVVSSYSITVDEIIDKMKQNETPVTSKNVVTQTIVKSNGSKSVSVIDGFAADSGKKNISIYKTPARIKGMKILMLNDGDDIWFYSPRTGRVRKIASGQKKQSVNGSDFSYEDMSAKDYRKDYTIKLNKEDKIGNIDCYKLTMIPKENSDVSYSKVEIWVDKAKFVGLKSYFYDEDGELWKKMTMSGIEKISGYWTPSQIKMENVLRGSSTMIQMKDIQYNIKVDESMFSERYLKQ